MDECANYVSRARLFAMCGHWPLPKRERLQLYYSVDKHKLPAWWGHVDEPPRPPEGMTEAQIVKACGHLETRGWTLVYVKGGWVPQRLI
jgi:hypothetical protein